MLILELGQRLENLLRSLSVKTNEVSDMFVSVLFIDYKKSPKLDYCFIMHTSLVPVAVSTWI